VVALVRDRGHQGFEIQDETYEMADAGEDSEILLTVEHPQSMRTVAWTRRYGQACVFCLQLGHDAAAWRHPAFQTLVLRGVQWCAQCM
jgi:type 1 glutamine amidotransferase